MKNLLKYIYCPNFRTFHKSKFGLYNRLTIDDVDVDDRYIRPSSFVPGTITQPFFELQTPDFAWKFVWIVQINYKSTKSTKKYKKVHKLSLIHI